MSKIAINRSHELGQEECIKRARVLLDNLITKTGGSASEDGNLLFYKHFSGAKGTLTVTDNNLDIDIKLSMLLSSLRKKIELEIERLCDKHLV